MLCPLGGQTNLILSKIVSDPITNYPAKFQFKIIIYLRVIHVFYKTPNFICIMPLGGGSDQPGTFRHC